jgi:hypothetical protein
VPNIRALALWISIPQISSVAALLCIISIATRGIFPATVLCFPVTQVPEQRIQLEAVSYVIRPLPETFYNAGIHTLISL